MSAVLRARILGCGSSGGVPRVDGDWGACDPANPKNRRLRCSLLLEQAPSLDALAQGASTRVLIDTSPDLRAQLLSAGVTRLDGLVYTHTHADQCHGVDDVRALVYRRGARLPAFAAPASAADLRRRFAYIFETPPGSGYPPLLDLYAADAGSRFQIEGPGGPLGLSLFDVEHGGAPCSGVRCGPIAYTPDVSGIDARARAALTNASLWIVDSLREKPHPSHAHVAQTLEWIAELEPGLALLTNLHVDLDYAALLARCPTNVRPSFDGLTVVLERERGAILDLDAP